MTDIKPNTPSSVIVPKVAVILSAAIEPQWFFVADFVPEKPCGDLPVFQTRDPVILARNQPKHGTEVWDALTMLRHTAKPEQQAAIATLEKALSRTDAA